MFVLLCGTSGSGRTEIAHCLRARFRWTIIPWTTTRGSRNDQRVDRIVSPRETFLCDQAAGRYYFAFEFFDEFYGIAADDVSWAESSRDFCVTDVLPSCLSAFERAQALVVGISVPSSELLRRLEHAQRSVRTERALSESHLFRELEARRAFHYVIESTDKTSEEIASEIEGRSGEALR